MYRVTMEITGRKQPPVLPECNDSHSDLAERFRVHFSENIMNVRSIMCHHDAPLPLLQINQHHNCTLSIFTPTTAAAIVRLVNKLPSKYCALDPWPTTLLETNFNSIATVLANIINMSLKSATEPAEMITPWSLPCSIRQVWTQTTSIITAL